MERQRSDKKTALPNSQKFDGLPKTLIKNIFYLWFMFLMVHKKTRTTKKHGEKTQNGQDFIHQEHLFLNLS